MSKNKAKCLICDIRPATVGAMCKNCHNHVEAETRKAKLRGKVKYDRFVTYQGKTICMVKLDNGLGKYRAYTRSIIKNDDNGLKTRYLVPKSKLIDLNTFCPDLNREEVKRLKRLTLELNNAYENVGVIYDKRKSELKV